MTDPERDSYGEAANDDPTARVEAEVPRRVAWLGLVLAGSAFLPLAPDGRRFVDLVLEAFAHGVVDGLVTLLGLGSPFLFGLAVAVATRMASPQVGARLVRPTLSFMHSQLVIVAYYAWQAGDAIAALPFLGFSIVAALWFAIHVASARASSAGGPTLRWYIRWGAMLITAIAAYCRLQALAGYMFGWATLLALLSAVLMLRATGRPAGQR